MGFYRTVARPLLFTLPPETAHTVASSALRLPLPWRAITGGAPPDLPTLLDGISLRNPVGLAAGFDKNAHVVGALAQIGFGYLVVGTVTREPRSGNPKPRISRTPSERSITNAMGIPNHGAAAVAERLERHAVGVPVLASLADEAPEDVLAVCELLTPLVAGFELNVSSPNSPWRHSGRDNAAHLTEVLTALPRTKPLFVKLPPFAEDDADPGTLVLARIAVEAGVSGLTIGNTVPVTDQRLAKGSGGLSGAPLTERTPRMVEALAGEHPGLALNACGGIFTAKDARRCLDAGATTVQLYTSFIYEGPGVVRRIVRGLAEPRAEAAEAGP